MVFVWALDGILRYDWYAIKSLLPHFEMQVLKKYAKYVGKRIVSFSKRANFADEKPCSPSLPFSSKLLY